MDSDSHIAHQRHPQYPDNGYLPVQRAVIDGNVIVDCKHSVLLAYNDIKKATVFPTQIIFRNQRIVSRKGRENL